MKRLRQLAPLTLLLLSACQQEMSHQPYYRPLTPTHFYPDGRSARPLVPGTVPRGRPLPDSRLLTGRTQGRLDAKELAAAVAQPGNALAAAGQLAASSGQHFDFVSTLPFELTPADLKRGQERFTIYCTPCHDPSGTGHGKIVERGYVEPPSYITDYSRGFERRGKKVLLRDVPIGYIFEVATHGYGAMPDYSAQVPPRDRWRIAAYIRALQLSQFASLQGLPEAERQDVRQQLEKAP